MAESIKYALPSQSGHDCHQRKQDCKSTEIDISEVFCVRGDKESGNDRQTSGNAQDRFFLKNVLNHHK